jgi:shikimate dehydrogenase
MINLALVGKNIQHSRSPDLYRGLIGYEIKYNLLDFSEASQIPSAKDLLSTYNGVSITSPYKKHFIPEIELTKQAALVGAINCLKITNGIIVGENTDFLAIVDILENWIEEFKQLKIIILGDGVMSNVTQHALHKCSITNYQILSRKMSNHFDRLNISEIFEKRFSGEGQRIVINTCSRNFIFNGQINKKTIFWDYNYNFERHSLSLASKTQQYVDGIKMLELQARYALAFWSIKTFDLNN